MKVLLFNGSMESTEDSVSRIIAKNLSEIIQVKGGTAESFHLSEANIPLFDFTHQETPETVVKMVDMFRSADIHIWLSPLYHGSITGAMKNSLDWLELSAKEPIPYLTDKVVGLVCWADGGQAMQGINAMDSIVKALRAWVLPYSIPIVRGQLTNGQNELTDDYIKKLDLLCTLLLNNRPK